MYFKCLLLLFILSQIEARDRPRHDFDGDYAHYERRPTSRKRMSSLDGCLPNLRHGKATKTGYQRIKFTCDDGYHLVGNKYATCRNSKLSIRIPSCARDSYYRRSSWRYTDSHDECELPTLKHGTIKTALSTRPRPLHQDRRSSGDIIRFTCDNGYQLVGNRFADCRNSEWSVPIPSCASDKGVCPIPKIENSETFTRNNGTFIEIFCIPGYELIGSSAIYCDGDKWNETVPSCVETIKPTVLSCDFEDSNICGWKQDELHDFDWRRTSENTPISILLTGPITDHTFGNGTGSYMYIDSASRIENDTARLISPIYEGKLAKNGCFCFYYHMFGMRIGGLRIYQKPENMTIETIIALPKTMKQKYILFEKWGNQPYNWYRAVSQLNSSMDDFQIIIEGIRGKLWMSDVIAIDDVAILQGENCTVAEATVSTPATIMPDSCSGRCNIAGVPQTELGCGCTTACIAEENCCPDFFDICVSDSTNTTDDRPDAAGEEPLTKKLEASTTPATDTTKSATKTPEPSKITSTTRLPANETTTKAAKSLSNEATITETSTLKEPTVVFETTIEVYNDTRTLQDNITTYDFKPSTDSKTTINMPDTKVASLPRTTVVPNPESTKEQSVQEIQVSSTTRRSISKATTTRMTAKSLSSQATTIETSTLKEPNVVFETTIQVNNHTGTLHKENSTTESWTTMKMADTKVKSLQRTAVVSDLEAMKGESVQEKKVTEEPKRSSGLKTGLIISAALLCIICAGAALLIMTTKAVRRRTALARLRGHATTATEVRYLNTNVDDDNLINF